MKNMLTQFIGFADAGEGELAQVELVSDADDIHQPHLVGLHVHDGDDEANILLDARGPGISAGLAAETGPC